MIYLDNNATTPLDPQVEKLYTQTLKAFGNPSSIHAPGREARRFLNLAREKIANLLVVKENTLTFTSGATEALNTALWGAFLPNPKGKHLIVSAVEHAAVLETARSLEAMGVELSVLGVDQRGQIDLGQLRSAIKFNTVMVAVMAANNETGNLYPVKEIGELTREQGVLYLCDGVQALGKIPVNLGDLPVDFFTASAHKFHGPKGAGLLYAREGVEWQPLMHGGRQERGRRGGTENLPGIVAMARALELALKDLPGEARRIAAMRDRLQSGICEAFPDAIVLGDEENRLPNTLNIHIPDVSGDSALVSLDLSGVAISIGAACEAGSVEPSHVLKAMGHPDAVASSGLRFSLSRFNTPEEIEEALAIFRRVVSQIRQAA